MNSNSKVFNTIRLFRTAPHPCSYLKGEEAITVFVDPDVRIDKALNSKLSELGYRRSGAHLYRPDCDHCGACVSCRIPVSGFRFSRRHRKTWKANQDLVAKQTPNLNRQQAYALYKNYINTRHRDGDMYPATSEQFQAFIEARIPDTQFVEFYSGERLLAVSVLDELDNGLSAVYTFFDPAETHRSLGIYVILWQIRAAFARQLPYLYLGYWIKDCTKMQYKGTFRPIEVLVNGNWVLLS